MDSESWKRHLKTLSHASAWGEIDLSWVVHELRSVKEGRARIVTTPDGHLTVLFPYKNR